jgi:hypothetical protein
MIHCNTFSAENYCRIEQQLKMKTFLFWWICLQSYRMQKVMIHLPSRILEGNERSSIDHLMKYSRLCPMTYSNLSIQFDNILWSSSKMILSKRFVTASTTAFSSVNLRSRNAILTHPKNQKSSRLRSGEWDGWTNLLIFILWIFSNVSKTFRIPQLFICIFIIFVTLYPAHRLHSWLMSFIISLMKYSLLHFCPCDK